MESVGLMSMVNSSFWLNKKVFVTGHTGFKGSWLCLWLQKMGAIVKGYALTPPTTPSLFVEANVEEGMLSQIADVRDIQTLFESLSEFQPEIVIHMAAQPLVRLSYDIPVDTYSTNVMGTVNLLDCIRRTSCVKAVVNVTSDKCYENQEWPWGYRENDEKGGHDPYSNSKGCAELVTEAFRKSYFNTLTYNKHGCAIASVRAGNVIGGGDWAMDRLIPDMLKAFNDGIPVDIRSPNSIRPWQHVLEPLSGYLIIAQNLYEHGTEYAEGWNFGPLDKDAKSVLWITTKLVELWGEEASWSIDESSHPHEANYLKLDCSKVKMRLDWSPQWELEEALQKLVSWHKSWLRGEDMRVVSESEISHYMHAQNRIQA